MANLLIDKEFAPEAQPPNMTEASRARQSFIESQAFPTKTETPMRVAALFLQNMIYRYLAVKGPMPLLSTEEHIETLVQIALRLYLYSIRETKKRHNLPSISNCRK
jgi:hypothetical protein